MPFAPVFAATPDNKLLKRAKNERERETVPYIMQRCEGANQKKAPVQTANNGYQKRV